MNITLTEDCKCVHCILTLVHSDGTIKSVTGHLASGFLSIMIISNCSDSVKPMVFKNPGERMVLLIYLLVTNDQIKEDVIGSACSAHG